MRVLNVLRNSIYSIISFIFISLLTIFVRKEFTQYLSVELLGLEGLFQNIVAILSLAELGISSIINYTLYKALAEKNKEEINILMNIYRYLYRYIGFFIFGVSGILYFFLPQIINEVNMPWKYVQFIYAIQILTVLSTYFISYKRSLFIADQKDYRCIKVDTICKSIDNIVKILAIIYFNSYVLYALSTLFFNIMSNLIISKQVDRNYSFIKNQKISIGDIKRRNFFKDAKNLLIHKTAGILYGGSDAVIVTYFLGLKTTGLMSNYLLIHSGIYSILMKIFQGIIPSIGNMVYSESRYKSVRIYKMLDMLYSFIGAYVFALYSLFLQSFMKLFFGEEYLLPDNYVMLLAINVFLAMQFENACNYRNTYGSFEKDRIYMILSAISKIFIAAILVVPYGISGLILGTIIGLMFIIYGRIIITYKYILKESVKNYLFKHVAYSLMIIIEIFFISKMLAYLKFSLTYYNLLFEAIITFLIMLIIHIFVYFKDEEFQDIVFYIRNIMNIILSKVKHNRN